MRIVAQHCLRRAHVAMFWARLPASVVGLRFGQSLGRVLRALGMRCG